MGNITRWFEDFPGRALDLLADMKVLAEASDRVGSLSLLIAPALIMAPYERLQTYAPRRNQQADYLNYPDARRRFDGVMGTRFRDAAFWTNETRALVADWRGSKVRRIARDPSTWVTEAGHRPHQGEFWNVDIGAKETQWVWKFLRDALSHWNVANADGDHRRFDEGATMQRLVFYRSPHEERPWDVVSVSPEVFLAFLEVWAEFLSRGLAREALAATEAA